ncbi:MAG: hypothetical protein AAF362_15110, partial [Pseudomonadota bacterium]
MPGALPPIVICEAPAKINLALHVTGQRDDGYHDLDTIVAFATIGDRITVAEPDDQSGENILEVTGPFAGIVGAGSDNLVVKAASKFQAATGNAAERPY